MNRESVTCNLCPLFGYCHPDLEPSRIVSRKGVKTINSIANSGSFNSCVHYSCTTGLGRAYLAFCGQKYSTVAIEYSSRRFQSNEQVIPFESEDKPSVERVSNDGSISWLARRVVGNNGLIFSWSPSRQCFLQTGQCIFSQEPYLVV